MPRWLLMYLKSLPGTEISTSKFGDANALAGFRDGKEFVHLHSDTLLDVRLPVRYQRLYKMNPNARFRPHTSAWMEYHVPNVRARKEAKEILCCAYENSGKR